jgi:hypothetical protein
MAAAPKYVQPQVSNPTYPPGAGGVLVTTPSPAYELPRPRGLVNPGDTSATHPNIATIPPPMLESLHAFPTLAPPVPKRS